MQDWNKLVFAIYFQSTLLVTGSLEVTPTVIIYPLL